MTPSRAMTSSSRVVLSNKPYRFAEKGTLEELAKHLFCQTFSPIPHLRDICRSMYLQLSHLVEGTNLIFVKLYKFQGF